ncbi:hypothetical protein Gotri_004315 [Gossypium trilobum]|uniref:DUF4283 domain-containing protein n=1 Tax=Gossypium trilobum TaxID=34281 RepID=A0A7J9F4E8_9ROSI|nr:hypothetical protein [Gossypium trilobum]
MSLEDEGYKILEVQEDPDFVPEVVELSLVGCFLTASLIDYSTMRSTMRVLRRSPWTFNNHLLMLHHLGKGKDPLKVPLIFINFWVQIHGVPPSFFTESLARQIGSFLGKFLEFNGTNLGKGICTYLRIKVTTLEKKEKRHNDSFCQAKMALRYKVSKIGWDLSLRANSGRARAMSYGDKGGNYYGSQELVRGFDPILRVNLEGDLNLDSVMVEGDGKKRPRREEDRSKVVDELKTLGKSTDRNKIIYWNVRGLGSPRAIRRLRYMLELHNPQVVFFMETKLCSIQMERVRSYGFFNGIDVQAVGSSSDLYFAWKNDVKINHRIFSNSHIDVDVIEDEIGG